MSLWRIELVSSKVALYVSWVDHRDVLVWTLSGRQYQQCVLEEFSELQNQDVFLSPTMGWYCFGGLPLVLGLSKETDLNFVSSLMEASLSNLNVVRFVHDNDA